MRYLILVIFLLSYFIGYSQMEEFNLNDIRKVDWKFMVENVIYVNDSTWTITAIPYDLNDPGAEDRVIGDYVKDNVSNIYKVLSYTETTLTVLDLQYDNFPTSPQQDQIARCYVPLNNGDSLFYAAGANNDFQFDEADKWKTQAINDEILARAIRKA